MPTLDTRCLTVAGYEEVPRALTLKATEERHQTASLQVNPPFPAQVGLTLPRAFTVTGCFVDRASTPVASGVDRDAGLQHQRSCDQAHRRPAEEESRRDKNGQGDHSGQGEEAAVRASRLRQALRVGHRIVGGRHLFRLPAGCRSPPTAGASRFDVRIRRAGGAPGGVDSRHGG